MPVITAAVIIMPALPMVFCCFAIITVPFFVVFGSCANWGHRHSIIKYVTYKDLVLMFEQNYQFSVLFSQMSAFAGLFFTLPLAMLATAFISSVALVFGTPILTLMTLTYVIKLTLYILKVIIY